MNFLKQKAIGRSSPRNCSHEALPFVEAAAKAKLAGSIETQARHHLAALYAFRIVDVPITAARNKDVQREWVMFGFHCRKLGLNITHRRRQSLQCVLKACRAHNCSSSDFHLVSAVTTSAYGLGKASTEFFTDLHLGTWYAADLVYDTDTLAVFVDGIIYSVHAFPDGTVAPGTKEILASALGKVPTAVDSFPPISKNYIHTTRGLRSGRLQYGLKQGLTQLILTSEAAAGETHTVQVKDLGTHTNAFTLKGYRDKLFSLQVHNKLGAGKDHLRISIDGIPLVAGGEVKINVKPGIGGVELVSAGQEIKATVSFEYVRRGTELNSKFELKEQNGLRVVPSTFITANQLKVSRINTLFGDSLSSKLVQAMP